VTGGQRGALALLLALALPAGLACRQEDPLAARLAQRTHYTVELSTFSARDDGTLLVEMAVRAGLGPRLDRLTVTVRQHAADESELRRDRVTLDLSEMDATGVQRLYTRVPADEATQALSVLVERDPPPSEYGDFPEIQAVAGD
jgi:hypothetical protein